MQAYFRTLVLDSDKNLSEKACGFLASFEFAALPAAQSLLVVAEASGLSESPKDPAWLRRFSYILKFLREINATWLLHFLVVSGEIDSIIEALEDNEQGEFPPLSTRQLL